MVKKNRNWLRILLWLLSVVVTIALMVVGGEFLGDDNVGMLEQFAIIAAVTLGFLYLISGKKTFTSLNNQTGYTVKMLFPTLIFSMVFGILGGAFSLMEKPPLAPDGVKNTLLLAASMFLVGVYEEGCFRACACDALLPALKNRKHPFLITAVVSGLLFGYVHVPVADFSDLQQTLQFILKIATSGLYGATLMILYWKTRNLLGLAIIHGLNDFLPGFLDEIFIFANHTEPETYTSGQMGTTILYVVQLAVNILCFIYVYRKVGRTIDYEKTLKEW